VLSIFRTNSFKKDYKKLNSKDKELLELALTRVGSHSSLFN